MIRVAGLNHAIGRTQILRNVDVKIPQGKVTALIGPNGAGKSTLLSLMARLQKLQSGTITVDGLNVSTCPSTELAKHLAILPQSADIALRLSVEELVAFGRFPHSHGHLGQEDHRAVEEAMEIFGLQPLRNRLLESLSGGQRQKALLAMIFAQDTRYLLLDEPLNNLDIAGARSLMSDLLTATRQRGRTTVIVLHDIAYALAYADHVVLLSQGHIVGEGPPQETLTEARIAEIYGTRIRLHQIDGRTLLDVGPNKSPDFGSFGKSTQAVT